MLYRFSHEVQVSDYAVFPSKSDRMINIGTIESEYIYNDSAPKYVKQRKVKWLKHLPCTPFSHSALYEIGSAMFFLSENLCQQVFRGSIEKF
jgi:restriction system protein